MVLVPFHPACKDGATISAARYHIASCERVNAQQALARIAGAGDPDQTA